MMGTVIYDRYFPVVCKMIGREDLISDERFNTEAAAKINSRAFVDILDEVFATKDYDEWAKLLTENDIAYDRVNHIKDTIDDPQAWENGLSTSILPARARRIWWLGPRSNSATASPRPT